MSQLIIFFVCNLVTKRFYTRLVSTEWHLLSVGESTGVNEWTLQSFERDLGDGSIKLETRGSMTIFNNLGV